MPRRERPALHDPRVPPGRWRRRLMLEHKGIPFKRTDLFPVVSKVVLRAARLSRQHRAGDEDRRRAGSRARARSPASWTARSPSRRSSRPTPRSGPPSRRPSASATRSCSTRSARSSGGRCARTRVRDRAATRRGRSSACRSASVTVKSAAPIVAALGPLQRGRPTRTSAPTSRRSPACCSGSTT